MTDATFGDEGGISSRTRVKMATIGLLEAFKPDNERMSTYLERVQLFFMANEIEEEK